VGDSKISEHTHALRLVKRRAGVAVRRLDDQLPEGADAVDAATRLAAWLSLNLDSQWPNVADDGPIDVIDVFSGAGGVSAGFKAVNSIFPAYRLALAIDTDPVANKTFEKNLGLAPVLEDVSLLAKQPNRLRKLVKSSRRRSGHPLVLIGCVPCQGFASHRNEAGKSDPRNSLFIDMANVAKALRPDAIVMENVPELVTTKYWPYLSEARRTLVDCGYSVHVSVENMAAYGVPQERFRMVLVAFKRPFAPPRGPVEREDFRSVREAIGTLPRVRPGKRDEEDPMHYCADHKKSTLDTIRSVPSDGGSLPAGAGPKCRARLERRQGGHPPYPDIYGRLFWDRAAVTITAHARNPASGRFVHPEQHRGLTVREAALLQGFPKSYEFEGGMIDQFRQIGNAVPPAFSAWLALYTLGRLAFPESGMESFRPGIEGPVTSSFSRLIPALKAGHRIVSGTA
jgi:DNA (cytosine-5)-methyltransferase 1